MGYFFVEIPFLIYYNEPKGDDIMRNKLVITKKDVNTGKKEWIYTTYDSIFDVKNNTDNEYILRKLNEIEKYFHGNDYIYEVKSVSEEELETVLFNNRVNNIKSPNVGTFFGFLVEYARYLDKLQTGKDSTIYIYNNNYSTLKSWTIQTLLKLKKEHDSTVR